ncbi:UPF0764 protein C16orf89 [Tribolium castaneum]|uniref:UPF0764 protein C16orf89-like Protein n=1 Tax=Tribolium castaneum TaxID=7070 RepID=A0A139WDH5_TRICA|nr:UPF0764 protein C16orf89-like Protein [Tribolium castaneum]
MAWFKCLVLLSLLSPSLGQIGEVFEGLNRLTDFALGHFEEFNFDGLLGLVLAEAQILQIEDSYFDTGALLRKFEVVRGEIAPILPKSPNKMVILERYLLQPENWFHKVHFHKSLDDLGIYKNWTVDDFIKNKRASYKGVPSDYCLMEILQKNCYVSAFCHEMMLAPRVDTGYLLSHRVFYLQIVRLKKCPFNNQKFQDLTTKLCSLMWREIRTNEKLDFPAHDIALEQMVFCGLEGHSEFLTTNWRKKILEWQLPVGCFKSNKDSNFKRTSNVITYGCTDHTTGLGAAALALHLRFLLQMPKYHLN